MGELPLIAGQVFNSFSVAGMSSPRTTLWPMSRFAPSILLPMRSMSSLTPAP